MNRSANLIYSLYHMVLYDLIDTGSQNILDDSTLRDIKQY